MKKALVEAFEQCDELLAQEPRMIVTVKKDPIIATDQHDDGEQPDAKTHFEV